MTLSSKTLFPVFLVCSAVFSALATAQGGPVVWTAPSLHRVGMSDAAGSSTEVSLSAARGEYQSFQIVASGANKGLGNQTSATSATIMQRTLNNTFLFISVPPFIVRLTTRDL